MPRWVGNLAVRANSRDHLGAMRLVVSQYRPDAIGVLVAPTICARDSRGDAYDPNFVQDEPRFRDWVLARLVMRPRSSWSGPFYRRTAIWQLARWLKTLVVDRNQWRIDEGGVSFFAVRNFRQKAVRKDSPMQPALNEYERTCGDCRGGQTVDPLVLITQPTFGRTYDVWRRTSSWVWLGLPRAEAGVAAVGDPRRSGVHVARPEGGHGRLQRANDAEICAQLNVECVDVASPPQTTEVYLDDMQYTGTEPGNSPTSWRII
jgi:hypothetical protein